MSSLRNPAHQFSHARIISPGIKKRLFTTLHRPATIKRSKIKLQTIFVHIYYFTKHVNEDKKMEMEENNTQSTTKYRNSKSRSRL